VPDGMTKVELQRVGPVADREAGTDAGNRTATRTLVAFHQKYLQRLRNFRIRPSPPTVQRVNRP